MGLFDFVGNIGKKLFGAKETKEDAAAKPVAERVARLEAMARDTLRGAAAA